MGLKNKVQLIGNVGQEPTYTELDGGKKVARFSLATNEDYKDKDGSKKTETNWHTVVAWGKTAEFVHTYLKVGTNLALEGKLKSRSYPGEDGNTRYVTEVEAKEILLLGKKPVEN